MIKLKENHLEWALKHLQRYSHSDFYPKLFEISAISHNWQEVKEYLLSIDMSTYEPKSPMICLAPKPNGNYRVAHQLEPIDSFIYTALIREICEIIEEYRIPESENIACSYRIKPDMEGSFFSKETGWDTFTAGTNELSKQFEDGYVIVADITDFYNQIYTHRINSLISEASKGVFDEQAKIIENFLLAMNRNTSRGIPVGPAPSIILAELIMGSIDNIILNHTKDFVRYVDDIRIFFNNIEDAVTTLHELTYYLYSFHRLVFSSEKTKILTVKRFIEKYIIDEEKEEKTAIMAEADELANEKIKELMENLPPYSDDFDYDEAYEETLNKILSEEQFKLLSRAYHQMFEKAVSQPRDYALLRHVLRQSARYRIRSLFPLVLKYFYRIRPVIREAVIYLNSVANEKLIKDNKERFETIFSHFYMKLPFINLWVSYLLQNEGFNKIGLPSNYERIFTVREQALIALRKNDTTWIRNLRDKIDLLGPWDKRAALYSASVLPLSEMQPLVKAIAASGDIIDKSIASFLISKKKTGK